MIITMVFFISWMLAEFYGYCLHILLHLDKVKWVYKNHMIHHLKIYGPEMNQRPDFDYLRGEKRAYERYDI